MRFGQGLFVWNLRIDTGIEDFGILCLDFLNPEEFKTANTFLRNLGFMFCSTVFKHKNKFAESI